MPVGKSWGRPLVLQFCVLFIYFILNRQGEGIRAIEPLRRQEREGYIFSFSDRNPGEIDSLRKQCFAISQGKRTIIKMTCPAGRSLLQSVDHSFYAVLHQWYIPVRIPLKSATNSGAFRPPVPE